MSRGILLFIFVAMGLLTFLLRFSFFALQDRITLPRWVTDLLRYAPAAVLFGLVAPSVLLRDGSWAIHFGNDRLLAAIVAAAIAWWRKDIFTTILVGMLAFWFFQWLDLNALLTGI